jgi:hypothetical protein
MLKRSYPFFRRRSQAYTEQQSRIYPLIVKNKDTTIPFLANQSPAENATSIVLDTNISFSINDDLSNVIKNSINCTVDGAKAIVGGSIRSAFNGSGAGITANASRGFDIVLNPTTDYTNGQTITIVVSAKDNSENTMTSTYSFTTIANVIESYEWDYSWWSSDVSSTSWPARDGGQDLTFKTAAPTTGVSTAGFTSSGLPTELVNNAVQIDGTSDQARTNTATIAWTGGQPQAIHIRAIFIPHSTNVNSYGYFGFYTNKYDFYVGGGTDLQTLEAYNIGVMEPSSLDITHFDAIDTPILLDAVIISYDDTVKDNGYNRAYVFINGQPRQGHEDITTTISDSISQFSIGSVLYGNSDCAEVDFLFFGIRRETLTSSDTTLMSFRQHQLDAAALGLCTVDDPFDYDWDLQWRSDDLSGDTWPSTPAGATLTRYTVGDNATTGVSTSAFADSWLDDDLEDTAVTLTTVYRTTSGTTLNFRDSDWTVRLIIDDSSVYSDGIYIISLGTNALRFGRTTDGIRILLYGFGWTPVIPDEPTGPMLVDISSKLMSIDGATRYQQVSLFINGRTYEAWCGGTSGSDAVDVYGIHGNSSGTSSTGSTTYSAVQIRIGQAITLEEHRADAIAAGLVV